MTEMMPLDALHGAILAVTLAVACVTDARRRTIPNALTLPALACGLILAAWHGGVGQAVAGIGVASLALLLYAARMLGAGDVKLLWAVGALVGPRLMGWVLLDTALAGGALAIVWAARRGALAHAARNAALGGQAMLAARSAGTELPMTSRAGRMPYAPAIALGVGAALWLRHWGAGL